MDSILTKLGLDIYHSEIIKYIQNQLVQARDTVLEYPSSLQFPTIGKENTIYIDVSSNKTYRWDNDSLKYYPLNYDDYNNIKIIDGCGDDAISADKRYNVICDESGNILTDELGNHLCMEVI